MWPVYTKNDNYETEVLKTAQFLLELGSPHYIYKDIIGNPFKNDFFFIWMNNKNTEQS